MSVSQLEKAVRAGYSGNDPVEKMGLFGMGFNISTARLGRRTEVWTTTSESSEWVGVIIDFDLLERKQTFSAPMVRREKTPVELETHARGTEVWIEKLEPERIRPLIWGAGKASTKQKLGKIYGRVMASLGVTILYDSDSIKAWRHCTWDAKRTVPTAEFGNVPARLTIDEELAPRKFCNTCWVWLSETETSCPACGETETLINRRRRLKGWIGVQRYFDKEHYGFDLIRNGRVIENLDKSLFFFKDGDGGETLEYPVDTTHWGGRIVGELEIDFVRVSHQKDSFDKLDPEWKNVIQAVRGSSPLRPKIAERMGLSRNTTPLARLYAGYKAGHAGLKELVPGDATGKGMNVGVVRDWVDNFYGGQEEYQTDVKWYQLVLQAENALRGGSSGGAEAGGETPIDQGNEPIDGAIEESVQTNKPPADTTRANGATTQPILPEVDTALSKAYELTFDQNRIPIIVAARRMQGTATGKPFEVEASGFTFKFDYYPQHRFFEESLDTPTDYMLTDLAHHFLAVAAESPRNMPVSMIEHELRKKYFPETLTTVSVAAEAAEAMLTELRQCLDEGLPSVSPIDPNAIDAETLGKIKRRVLQDALGDDESVNQIIKTGRFAKYVDNRFLIKMVEQWPGVVMDGELFSNPYKTLSADLKSEAVGMLRNGLEDIRWLAEEGSSAISKDVAWRLRYARALASMQLVASWRS
jgi:hypothetical protein